MTQSDLEPATSHGLVQLVAFCFQLLRGLSSFMLAHLSGEPEGKAHSYLNVRCSNREEAIKQQVGTAAKNGLQAGLASNPILAGAAPLLSNAFGGLMGNIAAAAVSDEDLTREISISLAKAFNDTSVGFAEMRANVCFLKGEVSVIRLDVLVSSDDISSLFALAIGPSSAAWYRWSLSTLRRLRLPSASRLIDNAMRTLVASYLARSFSSSAKGMGEQLASSSGGPLKVHVLPLAAASEAEFLFDTLSPVEMGGSEPRVPDEERWQNAIERWKTVGEKSKQLRANMQAMQASTAPLLRLESNEADLQGTGSSMDCVAASPLS